MPGGLLGTRPSTRQLTCCPHLDVPQQLTEWVVQLRGSFQTHPAPPTFLISERQLHVTLAQSSGDSLSARILFHPNPVAANPIFPIFKTIPGPGCSSPPPLLRLCLSVSPTVFPQPPASHVLQGPPSPPRYRHAPSFPSFRPLFKHHFTKHQPYLPRSLTVCPALFSS